MKELKYKKTLHNKYDKSIFEDICKKIPEKHKGFVFDGETKDLDGSVIRFYKNGDDIIAIGNGKVTNDIRCVSTIAI